MRLAFLIPPTKAALRRAIQVNSSLWGGVYNPIIPLYSRAPAAWKQYPREKIATEDRIRGYIALHFFQQDRSLQTTPAMSFTATHSKTGKVLEADLGLLWQETIYGETEHGILFAECKSYNHFKKDDFARMRSLAEEFPGAVLAFCTLRKTLELAEIREITRIANAGRKYWKSERPINPVLVLTGQELFNHFGTPTCWKDLAVPEWTKRTHTLLDQCNATQAIYLGLPHWQETWSKQFEKKRARKQKRAIGSTPAAAAPTN